MEAIKITLVDIKSNLKEQAQNCKDNWSVLVKMDSQKSLPLKQSQRFKLKEQNKPKVNPKHSAHYTLLWIVYIDNYCNFHYVLKAKYSKYPRRTKWNNNEKKFQDTKVIYK